MMNRSVFGWDLPPGVTSKMIDDSFGSACCDDPDHLCDVCKGEESEDGEYDCEECQGTGHTCIEPIAQEY